MRDPIQEVFDKFPSLKVAVDEGRLHIQAADGKLRISVGANHKLFRMSKTGMHHRTADESLELSRVNAELSTLSEQLSNLESVKKAFEAAPMLDGADVLSYCGL